MKKRGFKMRSGSNPPFKEMGGSPHKFAGDVFGQNMFLTTGSKSGDHLLRKKEKEINKMWDRADKNREKLPEAARGEGRGGDTTSGIGTEEGGGKIGGLFGGKLRNQMGNTLGGDATQGPDLQPTAFNKATYAEAKAKDTNLDKYIAERKKYKAGSKEYEAAQAKINAAYGTKRSEKLKAAQIKKHKDDPSRKGSTKKETTTTRKEYIPQTVSPRKEYDPASRNKRKEYIPQSQR